VPRRKSDEKLKAVEKGKKEVKTNREANKRATKLGENKNK
jgi:hypothetical protein